MYFFQLLLSAMPKIAADLDGMHLYSWGVSIPNLGLAFAMLIVGKLSDMYGRRALLLICLAVCLAGTVWSACCSTFEVLKNRSFITIAAACLLSSFGMVGLTIYYPLLMQGVQGISATETGTIMTLGNVLMNFLGVPAGFLLARTGRYKWMYLVGYGLTLVIMSVLIFFNAATPIGWGFVAFTLAGIGMGAIPTLNALVAQYSVPKRLLGVAMGALYFSVMIGNALAPAILGSAMNMQYNSTLTTALPAEESQMADQATMTSLGNPRVLLNDSAMESLRTTLHETNANGESALKQTVSAIRQSMESGLRIVFILGAIAMLLTFLIICTVVEVSIDAPSDENKVP
jgi:MFS family permease